jgi:hypothetical protein
MSDYTNMTDAALDQLYAALGEQIAALVHERCAIIREQACRRVAWLKYRPRDEDQADYEDEASAHGVSVDTILKG